MAPRNVRVGIAGFVVFVAAFGLYLSTAPDWYSGDDLQYASLIEEGVTGRPIYHPTGGRNQYVGQRAVERTVPFNLRYALEMPTSVAVTRIEGRIRGEVDALRAILVFRALAGAVVVAFAFAILIRLGASFLVAAIGTAAVAFSAATWTYSTHADQTITAIALLVVGLYLGVRARSSRRPAVSVIVLAVCLGCAALYNLLAVVPASVILAGTVLALPVPTRGARIRAGAMGAAAFFVTFVGGLVVLSWRFDSVANLFSLDEWRATGFVGRPEYGLALHDDLVRAAYGFAESVLAYPNAHNPLAVEEWDKIVTLIAVASSVVLLARSRSNPQTRWAVAVVGTWFTLCVFFNVWWDPGYAKYWVAPLVAWWLFVALSLAAFKEPGRRLAIAAAGIAVVVIACVNGATLWWPHRTPDTNQYLAAAKTLRASHSDALFIAVDQSLGYSLDFYISYFTRRDVISTSLLAYGLGQPAITSALRDRIRQHRSAGGPIYVYGLASASPEHTASVAAALPLDRLKPEWSFGWTTVMRLQE